MNRMAASREGTVMTDKVSDRCSVVYESGVEGET